MGVGKATQQYREEMADMFINMLQEKELTWRKEWSVTLDLGVPVNAISGTKYRGNNLFRLMMTSINMGYTDNRWLTFNKIREKGWHLKAGSKQAVVEYWMPYDFKVKKALSWKEYEDLIKTMTPEQVDDRFGLTARYYGVFNGCCVDGIPELKKPDVKLNDIKGDELIDLIAKNMGVPILNDGRDKAFYKKSEDTIHLPIKEVFETEYAYNSTALHELGHATGHISRLNRTGGIFGDENYAFEELIAEITSCFMSVHLNTEPSHTHLDNHKAYVQSWIKSIKEKPDSLVKAIKEADKAANFMEEKAGLNTEIKAVNEGEREKKGTSMKEKER